jgi:CHASE1-domain containing sensor protein
MSKMNFSYMPPQKIAQPSVRPPLLVLGYLVLAATLAWTLKPLLIG